MQTFISFFALFLGLFACSFAQNNEINNVQTSNHLILEGTNIAMIKPDSSFKESRGLSGFANRGLDAVLSVRENYSPFDSALHLLEENEMYKPEGLMLQKDFVMNGYKAKLYKYKVAPKYFLSQKADSTVSWTLLYGNEQFSLSIIGLYPLSNDKVLSDKYEKSLMSFILLEKITTNPIDRLNFTIDVSASPLKFSSTIMDTGALYQSDTENEENPSLTYTVLNRPFPVEKGQQEQRAVRNVKSLFDETVSLKSTKPIEINGLKGYEVIGYDKDKETLMLIYAVTLFDKESSYTLRGTALKNHNENVAIFRKVSKTFKIKGN